MSQTLEQRMLQEAAEEFGSQSEIPGQDFSQFDAKDGQHYGRVVRIGTRITSGGYFQCYIRFSILSGPSKGHTPDATFSLPNTADVKQIKEDLQSTNDERKARAENKIIGLRMLKDAYYRMTDDNKKWTFGSLLLALSDGSLEAKLKGCQAELRVKHSKDGFCNTQVRRGVLAAHTEQEPDSTLPDPRLAKKKTTKAARPKPKTRKRPSK